MTLRGVSEGATSVRLGSVGRHRGKALALEPDADSGPSFS
jgi:hypothetical protein